ncbi:hypothetical protein [Mycoplasma sp. ATU-Cv-508]|uniref:hypothetical protein n=1 Tax=Mycoplasma sp. ATU-Cv-508 TaxID=2048001 RepID=UPI000FDE9412
MVSFNKGQEPTSTQMKEFNFQKNVPFSLNWIRIFDSQEISLMKLFRPLELSVGSYVTFGGNLWYPAESRWVVPSLEIKLDTHDEFTILSQLNQVTMDLETTYVKKVIPSDVVFQMVKDSFQGLLDVETSWHSELKWDLEKFKNLVEKIENHSLKLEISTGSTWTSDLPAETALYYKNRFLKFRISKGANWSDSMRFTQRSHDYTSQLGTEVMLTDDQIDLPKLRKWNR